MLALNLSYLNLPDFKFDQDLYSDDLPFNFKKKVKLETRKTLRGDKKLAVLYDNEKHQNTPETKQKQIANLLGSIKGKN